MNKTFKRFAAILSVVALVGAIFIGCGKSEAKKDSTSKGTTSTDEANLQTVRLNEVVRSVFYAPMYVAINEGFFEEEGLNIDLSTGQGADKTMQQLLSGNADIGFSGPEQVVYIYNQGREDYPVVFGQLTQKDGSFLVGREAEEDFDSRKHIVDMLNVYASLVIEDEEKVAYVTCVFKADPERLLIVSPNIYKMKRPENHSRSFAHRCCHARRIEPHPHIRVRRHHAPFL